MAISPLTRWKCDSCGGFVNGETGFLEWIININDLINPEAEQFFIVHNKDSCLKHSNKIGGRDNHLKYYIGTDGLQQLLAISYNHNDGKSSLKDMSEFTTIVRRLHIPYFEEARLHFLECGPDEEEDPIELASAPISTLKRIADKYEE